MSWIQTYTGKRFWPMEPQRSPIDIRDIAHSLAMQCRFNGHCLRFYSVAEHSVRVSRIVSPAEALWGLLHDAAEAYVSDLPRPLKRQMPAFCQAEDQVLQVIVRHFGLSWPMPPGVCLADDILLKTELRDLMAEAPESWQLQAEPLEQTIEPVGPDMAEKMFLARFHELHR